MNLSRYYLLIFCFLIFIGCTTYHLTTQSLLEQFANSNPEQKNIFFIAPPFFLAGSVNGNSLRTIRCFDKDEKEHFIGVDIRTGIRITKRDSTTSTFYFDTLIIKDSILTGSKTHFFGGWQIKPIKLDDIIKVEIMP